MTFFFLVEVKNFLNGPCSLKCFFLVPEIYDGFLKRVVTEVVFTIENSKENVRTSRQLI